MEFNLSESIQILSKTPTVLETLLKDLPEVWTKTNEGESTWSPYDVVGHLIHGEKTDWIPRAMIIMGELADKTFEPFDRFAQFENSNGKSLDELLTQFSQLRNQNLEKLHALNIDEKALQRTGVHPEFGMVTLKQLLSTWTVHDLSHINQITRVMAKNYKNEAGPWVKYLSILRG